MKLLAITCCTVGVTHAYIAAEKLIEVAKDLGIDIKVEIHSNMQVQNQITRDDLEDVNGVIVATDITLNLERFEGLVIYKCDITSIMKDVESVIKEALKKIKLKKENKVKKFNISLKTVNTISELSVFILGFIAFIIIDVLIALSIIT